ncbi:ABC transporter permease [Pukyongiella litopenaei]|uniref:ABC transporter permease n=1 Tax=Pukyongiella litopenaei TaxID=2605946 RepID=A0A2S0MNV6_9RHOB|nr:ABC transporter permease [Pukyongiella litopenaei]AVO37517.1 ABC transporter permease [Pukyongiella litopenaei]
MARTILSETLKRIIVLVLVITATFLLVRSAPGDPAEFIAGESASGDPAFIEALRARMGLDKPLIVQLGIYLGDVAVLDLGMSYREGRPVLDMILERLPNTLILAGTAFVMALVMGTAAGFTAAVFRGTWIDRVISLGSVLFFASPYYWVALLAIILFSAKLGWLPSGGTQTIGAGYEGARAVLDYIHHLIMPATASALFTMAIYARLVRASMTDVANTLFVKAAHAKGMVPGRVWFRHVLRTSLLPITTMAGVQAGQLVAGTILTETVFAWPGIGRLMYDSLVARDYNVVIGVFIVTSLIVILANLVVDLLYRFVDPRTRAA